MPYYFYNPVTVDGYIFANPFVADDSLGPLFVGSVTSSDILTTSFNVNYTIDSNSTVYAVAVAQGSAVPTPAQIKAGVDYGAVTVLFSGNAVEVANVAGSISVTGMTAGDQVTVYLAAEDTAGNLQAAVNVRSLTVTLAGLNTPPTVSGNYAQQIVAIGQVIEFNASTNFTDTDALSYSTTGITGASINTTSGIFSWIPDTAGSYTATVTATDTAGQSASAQLPFAVIYAPAPVAAPYNRTVEWLNVKTPDLVIGDTFVQTLTLKQGSPQENCNVLAAESIKSAIVTDDNSMALSDVVSLSSGATGAAWVNGVLVVDLGEAVTAQAASEIKKLTYGKIEIEVVLNGDSFTWFAPVRLIPGYID
jgi:hypothetical protein